MRLDAAAPDLATSFDGAYVACAGARLTLYATASRKEVASAPLDGAADLAFVGGDRLLVVVPGAGRTQLHGFALPSLELLATLELEDRLRIVAAVGPRVLVATEGLEHPRVVAVTTKILVESIGLREPLMLATAAPEERLLAASRTREAQLECWDPLVRRALFRLNLPLMPKARLAGFSARRRLLWIASEGPKGMLEVFRFSDGRLQARVELGAPIVGAVGDPESPRLIVATRAGSEAPLLTELDFQSGERRELAPPVTPRAMAVVEGAAPSLVLVDGGAPTWMALGHTAAPEPIAPTTAPPARGDGQAQPRVIESADWRNKLKRGGEPAPPRPAAASATTVTTTAATTTTATATTEATPVEEIEPATHWRDALADWAEKVLATPRRELPAPSLPDEATLAMASARMTLEAPAALALTLVYGARLVGHGEGVAAATVARALTAAGAGGDDAWAEALGRGLLGSLGLVRAQDGRLRASVAAARFLDGAPPRFAIVDGTPSDVELPEGNVRLDGAVAPLDELGRELARRYGYDVALLKIADRDPARQLRSLLVEARLHGAWPVVDVIIKAARWAHVLDDGPTVIVARGEELPARVQAMPSIDVG
jgi:hypothetical protein